MDLDLGEGVFHACGWNFLYSKAAIDFFLSWKQFEYKASFAIDFLRKPFKVFAPWIKYYVKGACLSFVQLNLVVALIINLKMEIDT